MNQQGFALILTLVMLAILSILGVMVLNTTDTELGITTNYRSNSASFEAAQVAMEYSKNKIDRAKEDISLSDDYSLLDDDSDTLTNLLAGLSLQNVTLNSEASALNEIDYYEGAISQKTASTRSAENTTNVKITDETGSSVRTPYYRVSVDTLVNGRSSTRIDALFERIAQTDK